jgi:hypothetical protein
MAGADDDDVEAIQARGPMSIEASPAAAWRKAIATRTGDCKPQYPIEAASVGRRPQSAGESRAQIFRIREVSSGSLEDSVYISLRRSSRP